MLSLLNKVHENHQETLKEDIDNLKRSQDFSIEKINDLDKEVKLYKKEMENTKNKIDNITVSNKILKKKAQSSEKSLSRMNLTAGGII